MTLPKTAAEYAELAKKRLGNVTYDSPVGQLLSSERAQAEALAAIAEALLANAAATLEAAALTTQVQRDSLLAALAEPEPDELMEPCGLAWTGGPDRHMHGCDLPKGHVQKRHHCYCGHLSRAES